jgi:hypothetical protein
MTCGAINPPEFIHCLENNQCGGCGGPIYNSETKDLLTELKEAMEKMPNDPQGLAGWLLSNYRFQKIGEGKPVDTFYRKGGNVSSNQKLKTDPTYNEFIKRNDAGKLVEKSSELAEKFKKAKTSKLDEIAAAIQQIEDPYDDDTVSVESDDVDIEDQQAFNELQAAGINPFSDNTSGNIIAAKDIMSLVSQGSEKPLPEEIALSSTVEGRGYLQRARLKKLKAQESINGGGGGVFRR